MILWKESAAAVHVANIVQKGKWIASTDPVKILSGQTLLSVQTCFVDEELCILVMDQSMQEPQ